MKKYIIGLFLVGFIFTPVYMSFAQVEYPDPGPSTSDCVSIANNLRYRDRDINKNGEVSTLQDFLQSRSYLNNEPTGYFGLLTFQAVKSFQKDNGISSTGYVGPITRGKIKALTCDYINTKVPIISGISGPQSLTVNETGTWQVSAYDSNGGNLSYSVNWGDEYYPKTCSGGFGCSANSMALAPQQSAIFTHSYSNSGIFTPKFTVINSSGQSASTSLSVKVGGVISNSSITVLSPNGGETLYKGNYFNINWQDTANLNCSSMGGIYCTPSNFSYDIYLIHYYPPCTNAPCPLAIMAPLQIAERVYGTSYNWYVGNTININSYNVPSGSYQISVCRNGVNGSNICDISDNPFTVQ